MDKASKAKMVLCGSPGDTGARMNPLGQPPSPMWSRLPCGTPSQSALVLVEGRRAGRPCHPSIYDGMPRRGVAVYWVISAPLPKLENCSTCSRKDCKMKSRRDCQDCGWQNSKPRLWTKLDPGRVQSSGQGRAVPHHWPGEPSTRVELSGRGDGDMRGAGGGSENSGVWV